MDTQEEAGRIARLSGHNVFRRTKVWRASPLCGYGLEVRHAEANFSGLGLEATIPYRVMILSPPAKRAFVIGDHPIWRAWMDEVPI